MKQGNKRTEVFNTETLRDDLKRRSVRGGLYTMSGEGINFLLRLASTAVLARILIPEHFGLLGMVTALTVIAERFSDLGLSLATVQRKVITHEQISTLFWINLVFGAAIMVIFCAFAKLIAWFYGDDRLIWITIAISTSFLWGGLTVQHQAILRRNLLFGKMAIVNLGATIVSILVAIVLAVKGWGYWALVWKEIARSIAMAVGTWLVCGWIPGLPVRHAGIGKMIRFGRDIAGFNLIAFFAGNFDQILLGKMWGANLLGIYRQATQLMSLPISYFSSPVQNVAEPALSLLQDDPVKYRQYYRKILEILSFVSMPLVCFLFVHSENIILLLLGDKWIKAAEIFRIFAVASFLQPVASTTGFVMISCGETKRYFLLGMTYSIILICALAIGIRWGAVGAAYGVVVARYVYYLPVLFVAFKNTPVSLELFFASILPSLVSSLVMGVVLFAFSEMSSIENRLYAIAQSVPIAVIVYIVMWMLIPGGNHRLKAILSDFVFIFKKAESA